MKKTMIALLALAGVAMGAEKSVVFDFGYEAATDANVININKTGDYKDAFSTSGELKGLTGSYSFTQEGTSGGMNNTSVKYTASTIPGGWGGVAYLCTMESAPTGWGDTFKDGLTSQCQQNDGDTYTITFTGLESGYYDLSVLGGYMGADNMTTAITLTLGSADITETTWASADLGSSSTGNAAGVASLKQTTTNNSVPATEGYTFDVSQILVTEGTLTVTIDGTSNNGNRTPLNGLALTWTAAAPSDNIPEPTTASLSLLALAGLAARRRRK